MKALTDQLADKFNTTSSLTSAITGGMYKDKAPESKPDGTSVGFPYCLYFVENSPSTSSFGTSNDYSQIAVRFNIYGVGEAATGTIMDTFHGVYRNFLPTLASGQCTNVYPMTQPRGVLIDPINEGGNEVRIWTVTYVYSIRN